MASTLNIGIVAHIDAGKTTLTEHILFESGVIRSKGRVDHATTVTDDLDVERKRGITIKEKTVSFNWNGVRINLLDTPGHADFIGEVVRAFHVLDMAVLVISAKESVQPQTVAIYNLLSNIGIPVVIFINKLDRIGADVESVRKDIEALGIKPVMMCCADKDLPDSKSASSLTLRHWSENPGYTEDNLLTLSEFDDDIITRFERGDMIDDTISNLAAEGKVVPVFMGVALHGIGVRDLMDELVRIHRHIGTLPHDAPASAIVYKISYNERRERKIYFRMYGGTIRVRGKYGIAQKPDSPEIQIKSLETINGAKMAATDHVCTGEIGVLTNVEGLQAGDIIGVWCDRIRAVDEVKPIFSSRISPVKRADRQLLLDALSEMNMENGELDFTIDDKSQITVRLFGEIQKEFIKTQLQDRYGIETEFSDTQTIFKETPAGVGKADTGLITFIVEPLPQGTGVRYEYNKSVGINGGLTKAMHAAVEEGTLASMMSGLHGWEVTDIRVIFDACSENVKSSGVGQTMPGELKVEAAYALRQALWNAGTQILEPIYYYEIVVHEELCGKAAIEIEKHHGSVASMEEKGVYMKLSGKLPARMSEGFLHKFQSLSKNMGSFDTVKVEYEPYEEE